LDPQGPGSWGQSKSWAGPAPLREGVARTSVSLFGSVSVAYIILYFHHAHGLAPGLGGARSTPQGVNLPEDTVRREVNCARNEKMLA
jgi:hypothetical protein